MGQQSNVGAAGCALVVGLLGSLTRTSPKQRCTAQLIMTRQKQRSRTLQILKDPGLGQGKDFNLEKQLI